MSLLTKAELDNAYLKMAFRGQSGSGKTWGASAIAIGLHHHIGSKKPIAFWDTENALSYVLPHFQAAGIEVLEVKSRSFADAKGFFTEAQQQCDIAIIDSVTHLWQELVSSYQRRKNLKKMRVWDWGPVKAQYREHMLENIINAPLHLLICGRLSDIFEFVDVDGDKVLTTTGTKMTAEKSTEYEPSLTVEMERYTLTETELEALGRAARKGAPVSSQKINKIAKFAMTIIKDRANVLAGRYVFEPEPGVGIPVNNAMFEAVKPYVETLSIGGQHRGVDLSRRSDDIFGGPDDAHEKRRAHKILNENIESLMKTHYTASKDDKKQLREDLLRWFGTASWTEITETLAYSQKKAAYDAMLAELEPKDDPAVESPIVDEGGACAEVSALVAELEGLLAGDVDDVAAGDAVAMTFGNLNDAPDSVQTQMKGKKWRQVIELCLAVAKNREG